MRNIALFAAAMAGFFVIGIDAWLCNRTIPAAATGSTFNRLTVTTGAMASTISHYGDYSLVARPPEWQKIGGSR
ncbi:MAG: hypothetical protein WAK55_28975 [Xanthobacteraceae bacterium]